MKTFWSTLAAILVAALVIFSGLYAKARVDQWERQLAFCQAQGQNLTAEWRATQRRIEMTSDLNTKIQLIEAELAVSQEDERPREIDRRVLALLENKPFGIPLTAQQRNLLAAFKTSPSPNRK